MAGVVGPHFIPASFRAANRPHLRDDSRLFQAHRGFFLLHGQIVVCESRLGVARWPPLAGRVWTLAIFALTAPLFVEPLLRAMGK